jgi:hypothetical protein
VAPNLLTVEAAQVGPQAPMRGGVVTALGRQPAAQTVVRQRVSGLQRHARRGAHSGSVDATAASGCLGGGRNRTRSAANWASRKVRIAGTAAKRLAGFSYVALAAFFAILEPRYRSSVDRRVRTGAPKGQL